MSHKSNVVVGRHITGRGRLESYIIGYALSVILTLVPFTIVISKSVHGSALIALLICFAFAQLAVQLQFFIHLGHQSGTPWNKIIFGFMMVIVFIIVIGSLQIMKNLDYHHGGHRKATDGSDTPYKMDDYPHYDKSFTGDQTKNFIIKDEGIKH